MKKRHWERMKRAFMLFTALLVFAKIAGAEEMVWPAGVVKLSETSVVMAPGTVKKLKLNGASSGVKWSSSSKKTVTVGKTGKLTAKAKGTASIVAKYKKQTYICSVTVKYMNHTTADKIRYKDSSGNFGKTGRWFKKDINGKKYDFTSTDGSAIYFKVTGSKYVDIDFYWNTAVADPYFAYSVDGGNMKRQVQRGEYKDALCPCVD